MSQPIVLQLVNSFSIGGAELLACTVAERLPALGFKVHVCALMDREDPRTAELMMARLEAAGAEPHRMGKLPHRMDAGVLLRVRQLARRLDIDVLHSHCISPDLHGAIATIGMGHVRLVRTLHSTEYAEKRWMIRAERLLRGRFERTVAISDGVRDWALGEGMDPGSLTLVENGVDVAAIDTATALRREELVPGIGADEALLISVGRMEADEAKGFPDLIEALALLKERGVAFSALLVGDGPMRPSYEARCRELGIGDHAIFLGRRHDVPSLLKAADLFVLASRREGLPLVDCEAGAAGLPVVATRIPGHVDVIEDGVDGLLTPPRDPRALADAVAALLADAARARAMGAALRGKVEERFSIERTVREHAEIYRQLATRR